MYGNPVITCFKYQVYLYGSEVCREGFLFLPCNN